MSRLSLLSQNTTNDLVVNIGDTANDRTGDPLRTAFNKIKDSISRAEQNFVELYATASADVQIPVQTNNGGKYLTTNGTTLSWNTIDTVTDQLVNGNNTVSLGSDGVLTLPNNGTINNTVGTSFQATTSSGLEGTTKEFAVGGDVDTIDNTWTATGGGIVGTASITNVEVGLSFTFVTFDQSFTATGPITFNSSAPTELTLSPDGNVNWSFGANSKLSLPTGGALEPVGMGWTGLTNSLSTNPVSVVAKNTQGNYSATVDLFPGNQGYVNVSTYNEDTTTGYSWNFNAVGEFNLPDDGSIKQNNSWTKTSFADITSGPTVVWSSSRDYISSAKLVIQVECNEVGDTSGWHSQACEAIIASRGYASVYGGPGGEPQMSVYGVIHTSVDNLITFSVQRNPITKLIEVVGTLTAAAAGTANLRIHSVELSTRD